MLGVGEITTVNVGKGKRGDPINPISHGLFQWREPWGRGPTGPISGIKDTNDFPNTEY